jgi:antitoxin (DNA-binding transcriptional repressor) of toxin-antitoxin stability system
MTVRVNVYEAKTNLSKLIEKVLAGERVVISRSGTPVVDLVRHEAMSIRFDGLAHQIRYDEDEFNAADSEIAAMFQLDDDSA